MRGGCVLLGRRGVQLICTCGTHKQLFTHQRAEGVDEGRRLGWQIDMDRSGVAVTVACPTCVQKAIDRAAHAAAYSAGGLL